MVWVKNKNKMIKQAIIALFLVASLYSILCPSEEANAATDSVRIVSITPDTYTNYTTPKTISVTIEYTLQSKKNGIVYLGFNTNEPQYYRLFDSAEVTQGSGTVTLSAEVTPVAWGTPNSPNGPDAGSHEALADQFFGAYVNLSENPHPKSWNPLATDAQILLYNNVITYKYQPNLKCGSVDLRFTPTYELDYESIKTSIVFNAAGYNGEAIKCMSDAGLVDIEEYSKISVDKVNTITFYIGRQINSDGSNTLVIVAPGSHGARAWVSDILLSVPNYSIKGGLHPGFGVAATAMFIAIGEYMMDSSHPIDHSTVSFWLSGHSRGGAVVNQTAMLFNEVFPGRVKAVTLATPNTSWDKASENADYILNIVDRNDPVPVLPPGGSKPGKTVSYSDGKKTMETFYGTSDLSTDIFSLFDELGESIARDHYPENYVAQIFSKEPEELWSVSDFIWVSIHCPVNIEVYDSQDNLVASVINGEIYSNGTISVISVVTGEKEIVLPANEDFLLVVDATGNGDMTYSTSLLNKEGMQVEVEETVIAINSGDKYYASFDVASGRGQLEAAAKMPSELFDEWLSTTGLSQSAFILILLASLVLVAPLIILAIAVIMKKNGMKV